MQVYQVGNIEIKCRIVGKGPSIILLHGFGGGIADWLPVAEILKEHFQVIIPNLTPFFSSKQPIGFNDQVLGLQKLIIENFVHNSQVKEDKIHLVGNSYGGLLSFGLRHKMGAHIWTHTLINPMPLEPLSHIKNWRLRLLLYLAHSPLFLNFYGRTAWGKKTFRHLGQIFHMGLRGKKRLHIFNRRKYWVIHKALKRFLWIDSDQDWSEWENVKIKPGSPTQLIYSGKDPLYGKECFLSFSKYFDEVQVKTLAEAGHLISITHKEWLAEQISQYSLKGL